MVYLAILLILCGLLILITALSVETGKISFDGDIKSDGPKSSYTKSSAGNHHVDFDAEEVEIIFPGDGIEKINSDNTGKNDIFLSFDDESDDLYKPESSVYNNKRNRAEDEPIKPATTGRPEVIEKRDVTSGSRDNDVSVSAVMYDDRSNIIDYESGTGVIDPTFSKYKSIKRVGKGKIESDYDGLNFYIDEKLYRFDFHKVYDIWSGSNYIALPLKGNSTVKLFIIENSNGFTDKVEANFKEYEKGL